MQQRGAHGESNHEADRAAEHEPIDLAKRDAFDVAHDKSVEQTQRVPEHEPEYKAVA